METRHFEERIASMLFEWMALSKRPENLIKKELTLLISGKKFNTRTIPDSYMLLKYVPVVTNEYMFPGDNTIADTLSKETPIVIIQNDCIIRKFFSGNI